MSLNIQLTCRHGELSEKLRDHATKKAERLLKRFDGVHTVEVILSRDGGHAKAEMIVGVVRGQKCVAEETRDDVFAAIDGAVTKVLRQLQKLKGKLREHHGKGTMSEPTSTTED